MTRVAQAERCQGQSHMAPNSRDSVGTSKVHGQGAANDAKEIILTITAYRSTTQSEQLTPNLNRKDLLVWQNIRDLVT